MFPAPLGALIRLLEGSGTEVLRQLRVSSGHGDADEEEEEEEEEEEVEEVKKRRTKRGRSKTTRRGGRRTRDDEDEEDEEEEDEEEEDEEEDQEEDEEDDEEEDDDNASKKSRFGSRSRKSFLVFSCTPLHPLSPPSHLTHSHPSSHPIIYSLYIRIPSPYRSGSCSQ